MKAPDRLLAWYDREKRDLPWRGVSDAYAIWLSEIMLQQTTVATVTPRWRRFLERWPTVRDLAAAPLDDVLSEWTGLGYYARARNLHRAAQDVVAQHDGELPRSYAGLLALPGLGPYTAAAVASIAFGESVAVLDANVERVMARWLALETDARSGGGKAVLRAGAAAFLVAARAGDCNQGLMELGATVCLPKEPRCGECPLARECGALAQGRPTAFPILAKKAPMVSVREVAVVVVNAGKFLLLKRPAIGSFAGMWETPRVRVGDQESPQDAAHRAVREQTGRECAATAREHFSLKHTVMRTRIELSVWQTELSGDSGSEPLVNPQHDEARWVSAEEWLALPTSTTQRRIARAFGGWLGRTG